MSREPSCIDELDSRWPWRQRLSGLTFITTRFDPSAVDTADFERCGIHAPASVRRAIFKRQAEYLAGRACAREALHQSLGIDAVPRTRPDRAPQWPDRCVGSITHSDGIASVIAGPSHQYISLGLDLEPCMEDERARPLVPKILTSNEQARFADPLRQYPGNFLALAFSLKESLFKALYPVTGRRFYFEHAELLDYLPDGTANLRLLTSLSGDWPAGTELEALFVKTGARYLSLVAIKPREG